MVKKASSCIAQYPVLRTIQNALHFTSPTDLFTQTPSRLLWEASSHMLQLMHEGCSYTYPPLSIARYSFIQLSELFFGNFRQWWGRALWHGGENTMIPCNAISKCLPTHIASVQLYKSVWISSQCCFSSLSSV